MMTKCNNHTCGVSLEHKRAGAKYCSRSCKDTESSRRNYEQKETRRVEWRKDNPDKVAAYEKKNKDEFGAAYRSSRRIAEYSATTDLEALKGMSALAKRLNTLTSSNLHVDHIEPLKHDQVCGLNSAHNLQLLNAEHNLRKSNKRDYQTPIDRLLNETENNSRHA